MSGAGDAKRRPLTGAALERAAQAYVDGALRGAELRELEERLRHEPALVATIERLRAENAALSELFDAGAAEMARRSDVSAPPEQAEILLRRRAREARSRGGRVAAWFGATGLAAGLAAGVLIGGGQISHSEAPSAPAVAGAPGWKLSAAIYQRLYTEETFKLAPTPEPELRAALEAVAARFGVSPAALAPPPGLRLARAQLLNFEGAPLAQISYVDANGGAVALCLFRRAAPGAPSAPEASEILDVPSVAWAGERLSFLLLGAAEPEALSRYADGWAERLG